MSYIPREDAPFHSGDLGNPEQSPSATVPGGQNPMTSSIPQLVEAPFVPMIHVKAFKIIGFLLAIGSFLMLLCGIVILAASSHPSAKMGGGMAMFTGLLCGVSAALSVLNAFKTSECRAIASIVLSVFAALGSSGVSPLASSAAAICREPAFSRLIGSGCNSPVPEFLTILIIVSGAVSILAVVQSAFSCRAMCCLRPQQLVMVNNNQATKL